MAATTGFTATTMDNLLLDAGAFYKNFNTTTMTGTLLGATQGGGEFSAKPILRKVEIDGIKAATKGTEMVEGWEVSISGNLLEVTEDSLKLALMSTTTNTAGLTHNVITANSSISDTDYLDNITWVGRLSGNAQPVLIVVKNALNKEGLSLKTEDQKEGVLGVKFEGHYDASDLETAPFEIHYPKAV